VVWGKIMIFLLDLGNGPSGFRGFAMWSTKMIEQFMKVREQNANEGMVN
jgi:hypothetical protein